MSGGVTSFLDMPNNKPSITNMEGMRSKLKTASEKCVNNYGFFIGATPDNVSDLQEAVELQKNRSVSRHLWNQDFHGFLHWHTARERARSP